MKRIDVARDSLAPGDDHRHDEGGVGEQDARRDERGQRAHVTPPVLPRHGGGCRRPWRRSGATRRLRRDATCVSTRCTGEPHSWHGGEASSMNSARVMLSRVVDTLCRTSHGPFVQVALARLGNSGSSRIESKSSSLAAHSRVSGSTSTAVRRCAIASSRRPASASKQASVVEHVGVAGVVDQLVGHQVGGGAGVAGVGERLRGERRPPTARPRYGAAGIPPTAIAVVPSSSAMAVRRDSGSGRNTSVAGACVVLAAVDREARAAGDEHVELLVADRRPEPRLVVLLDQVLARVRGERVDPERR